MRASDIWAVTSLTVPDMEHMRYCCRPRRGYPTFAALSVRVRTHTGIRLPASVKSAEEEL